MATGLAETLMVSFKSLNDEVYSVLQTEDDFQYEQQIHICDCWLAHLAQVRVFIPQFQS